MIRAGGTEARAESTCAMLPPRANLYLEAMIPIPEAAALLGVTAWTMHRILDDGLIPFIVPRKQRRIRRGDVLAYKESVSRSGSPTLASSGPEDLLRT